MRNTRTPNPRLLLPSTLFPFEQTHNERQLAVTLLPPTCRKMNSIA